MESKDKNTDELKNAASLLLNKAIDIAFSHNPKGSAWGIFFGVILNLFINAFRPALEKFKNIVNFDYLNLFNCILFGFCSAALVSLLTKPKHKFDKDIEDSLAYINNADKSGNFSKLEIKAMHRELHNKILSNVTLKEKTQNQLNALGDILPPPGNNKNISG